MFVVAPVARTHTPDGPEEFTISWPVVFENTERGFTTDQVGARNSRDAAQELADALNGVLKS